MLDRIHRNRLAIAALRALTAVCCMCLAVRLADAAAAEELPSFRQVQAAVFGHFQAMPEYQPGDLISRRDVEPLFDLFERLGWTVADRKAIVQLVPTDNEFLVRTMRSWAGQKFMRRVSGMPLAYDRIDRLSRPPQGKQTIRDLVKGPDGYKMIEYMTTAKGGVELGRMLSKAPQGAHFNEPTGRIYTVDLLLARLKKSHAEARKHAGAAKK